MSDAHDVSMVVDLRWFWLMALALLIALAFEEGPVLYAFLTADTVECDWYKCAAKSSHSEGFRSCYQDGFPVNCTVFRESAHRAPFLHANSPEANLHLDGRTDPYPYKTTEGDEGTEGKDDKVL